MLRDAHLLLLQHFEALGGRRPQHGLDSTRQHAREQIATRGHAARAIRKVLQPRLNRLAHMHNLNHRCDALQYV